MGLIGGCCLSLLALFAPPIPVLIRTGCGSSLFINCILTILGWIPGVFHAWYIILRYPDGKHNSRRRKERERASREEVSWERRSTHRSYGGNSPGGGRRSHSSHSHSHHHHKHGNGHGRPGSRGGYYAPPPAATQGMYYPQQETGRVRY